MPLRRSSIARVLLVAGVLFPSVLRAADAPAKAATPREREQQFIAVLKGEAPAAEKDKACRELQRIGTRACIPALAALLPDETLSHMARYALEPMPYPEAGQALRDALAKASGPAKVGVIASLGFRRDRQAAGQLIPLLRDPDPAVAAAAATALGRAATPAGLRSLRDFRSNAPEPLRAAAAEGSLAAAERLVREGRRSEAVQICEDLRSQQWPSHVRLAAFAGLLAAEPEKAVARVVQAIAGADAELRAVAIANVSTLKGDRVVERIAAELPKLPPDAQVLLVAALARRDDPAVAGAILRIGKSSKGEVRAAAAKALGAVGDASCTAWLAQVVTSDASRQEQDAAAQALVVLKGEGVAGRLTELMARADASVRGRLIEVLMRRNDKEAADAVFAQAGVPDVNVRRAAFKALARLADAQRLPALLGLLVAAPDDAARADAEKAVAQVARRTSDPSKRSDLVLAALTDAKQPAARCSLLRVLASIGGPRSLAAVRASLDAKDEAERDAAIRSLALWSDAAAAEALLDVCRAAKNETHRILALRGLARVLVSPGNRSAQEVVTLYREAIALAQGPDEKKMLLSGLAQVGHPDALAMAMAWLGDAEVHAEAALAAIKIAETVLGSDRDAAVAAMTKLATVARDPKVQARAQAGLRRAKELEDYVVAWQVAGPYSKRGRGGKHLFDVALPPEKPGDKSVQWRLLPPRSRAKQPWMLDLRRMLGGEQCIGYARTWLHSEGATAARLEIGVDDGIKVWLNGEVVYGNNSAGAAVAGEEKADVALKQGWNSLLLKVVQHTGPWEFCARFRTPDGQRLEGLRIDSMHGGPIQLAVASPEAPKPKPEPKRAPDPPPSAAGATDWTPLFNGKDLTGWRATGKAVFKVQDQCLLGTQTSGLGGDLWHEREFDDFELRVTYRMKWPANSGFWFRHSGKGGYQYDVLKYKSPVAYSGTLYCPGKMFLTQNLDESLENREGWNEAEVRAKGDELTLWLNSAEVGHCRDTTHRRGRIGIQVHPGKNVRGMQIVIKRMEVRLLSAPKATDAKR